MKMKRASLNKEGTFFFKAEGVSTQERKMKITVCPKTVTIMFIACDLTQFVLWRCGPVLFQSTLA